MIKQRNGQTIQDGEFLTDDMTNRFNNLLTSILGHTELALHFVPQDSTVRRHLEVILASGRRTADLIQEVSSATSHVDATASFCESQVSR